MFNLMPMVLMVDMANHADNRGDRSGDERASARPQSGGSALSQCIIITVANLSGEVIGDESGSTKTRPRARRISKCVWRQWQPEGKTGGEFEKNECDDSEGIRNGRPARWPLKDDEQQWREKSWRKLVRAQRFRGQGNGNEVGPSVKLNGGEAAAF